MPRLAQTHLSESTRPTLQILHAKTGTSTILSTSDCGSLASPYTPPFIISRLTTDGISCNLYCGTDFYDHRTDIMAFTAFTFEDCIGACATFNHQAAGLHGNLISCRASFVQGNGENGGAGCYLKGIQNMPPTLKGNADSARLIIN